MVAFTHPGVLLVTLVWECWAMQSVPMSDFPAFGGKPVALLMAFRCSVPDFSPGSLKPLMWA